MYHLRAIILLGLPFILSCSPEGAPAIPPLPPPPPRAAAVAPEVSKVRESIADADKNAAAIRDAARHSSAAAKEARQEAERLAERRSATPDELNGLWKALQSLEARNLFLEAETESLTTRLTALRTEAAALQQTATARDAEATQLRALSENLTATANHCATTLDRAHKQTALQRSRADKLAGEIHLYRIALGIAAMLAVLWAVVKLVLPVR